jgi:microcystin-dependent protein
MAYIGEIRIFAGNFAPAGWMFCEGQLIPISENDTLFAVIGTTYGGDGQETFALPDLQGRLPVHQGTGKGLGAYVLGEAAGVEEVTLNQQQIPTHTHALMGSLNQASATDPTGNLLAKPDKNLYRPEPGSVSAMATQSIGPAGGNQPHTNFQPYLCMNYIISLFGIFPTQ